MSATIIDGRAVADRIRAEITEDAKKFTEQYGIQPGLGVVLVGDDPASHMYVRMKRRACERVGLTSYAHILPEDLTQAEVEQAVAELNADEKVHGILVQLPMPKHIDEEAVLRLIDLEKDSDAVHPLNMGLLAMKDREPTFTQATPTGSMILIEETGIDISGKHAVVIGRSNIVGLPMVLMLNHANATVTMCHSRTQNMKEVVQQADILVVSIGQPEFVKGDWIKPGAVVIDVGSNQIDAPETEKGYRYVGDVEFETAKEMAGYITKVPGGVGPMTITMLLKNTMQAAWEQMK